ncbi:hypothetical protein Agabi119p4_8482 [Agaricus bisporus var. burnettii]|uniref:Uncharacterized protein n=1 Tax=Agaricus bisporus var. burnettii TaxID=192524 RepID=A0A8H7C770_AGABI|nr:hypothetical protein Agabi119p4_8482 [Agaricus bisporus var. burnettii]
MTEILQRSTFVVIVWDSALNLRHLGELQCWQRFPVLILRPSDRSVHISQHLLYGRWPNFAMSGNHAEKAVLDATS